MAGRYVCDRCVVSFDGEDGRCPNCLRKSSVREAGERASSEAMRLAHGDHSLSTSARRATALWIAIGLTAAAAVVASLASAGVRGTAVQIASAVGVLVTGGLCVWAAVAQREEDRAPWRTFAKRCGAGMALGVWATVASVLAVVMTAGLSAALSVVAGVVLFAGGVIPALMWLREREEPTARPTGKWR